MLKLFYFDFELSVFLFKISVIFILLKFMDKIYF